MRNWADRDEDLLERVGEKTSADRLLDASSPEKSFAASVG
jgi:hypothetical protein